MNKRLLAMFDVYDRAVFSWTAQINAHTSYEQAKERWTLLEQQRMWLVRMIDQIRAEDAAGTGVAWLQ